MAIVSTCRPRSQDLALEPSSDRNNHSPTAVAALMSVSSIGADGNEMKSDTAASVVSNSDSSGDKDMADHKTKNADGQISTNGGVETVLNYTVTGDSTNSDDHSNDEIALKICDTGKDLQMGTTLLCCMHDSRSSDTVAAPVTSYQSAYGITNEAENEIEVEALESTSWTESTRQRFEMGIESLLSSVSTTTGQGDEERYRSMVQAGLSNLEEKYEASTEGRAAYNNVNNKIQEVSTDKSQQVQDGNDDDEGDKAIAISPNPLTLARRNFSPLERSERLRHMRREMSLSDRDESSNGAASRGMTPIETSRTSSAPIQGSRQRKKISQSFDDEPLRSQKQKRTSELNSTKQSRLPKFRSASLPGEGYIGGGTGSSRPFASSSSEKGSLLAQYFQHACMCGDGGRLDPVDEENDILVSSSFIVGAQLAGCDSTNNELLHGYDSDPELFHAASSSSSIGITKRDSKRIISKQGERCNTATVQATRSLDLEDDKATSRLIDELVHDTMNLILHPDVSDLAAKSSSAPSSQRVWVELGSRVQGQIIQPKLVWRTARQKTRGKKGCASNADEPTTSIDILDISRVRELSGAERQDFPLANRRTSFVIATSDHLTYIFEAKNTEEKDRITLGLKLLVARLASLIIVGDQRLFADFFYHDSAADFHRTFA